MGSRERKEEHPGEEPSPGLSVPTSGPPGPSSPAWWRILLPVLLLLILPTGWVRQDETLNLFLALALVATTALVLWRRGEAGGDYRVPLFAIPSLALAVYLLGLMLLGVAGYEPHAPVFRLFIGGALLTLTYNVLARGTAADLLLTLRWLVLLIALSYFPITHWDLVPELRGDRFRFTFGHPNALGCFLALSCPFLLVHPWLPQQGRRSQALGIVAIAAAFFLAGATESRMALLLMVAEALILLPWLAHTRRGLSWMKALPATVAAVAGLLGIAALFFGTERMATKFSRILEGGESGRVYMWRAVGDMITDKAGPGLAGHGAGILYRESWNFSLADYGYFGRGKADAFAHNQVLDWTLEGGLIGFLAFGAFALLLVIPLARSLAREASVDRRLLRGALLLSALAVLLFAQVSITSQFATVISLAAILLGGMTRLLDVEARTLRLPRGSFLLLGLLALAGMAIQFPRVMSDRHLAHATRLMEPGGDAAAATARLRKSLDWHGGNVHAWYLRLLASHNGGNRKAVEESHREIEERIPNFMATRLVFAAHLANQGRLAEALPVLDGYLEVNAYDFNSSSQFLVYAHYLKEPGQVERGLERLLRTHISAIAAKGGTPPSFEKGRDGEGQMVWTITWEAREPITMPVAQARERLFRGLKGNLGHDYPVVIGNARRLMGKFGFDRNTLEKGPLAE